MDAYLSYPFDGVLYFLNIHEYHNPHWGILDQLSQISKLNGTNIFKIPLKIIVLSSKKQSYLSISQRDKKNFVRQLEEIVDESMIVFVQDDHQYHCKLGQFIRQIIFQEAKGISESFYVNWQLKGFLGLVPVQYILLHSKKMVEGLSRQWMKLTKKWRKKKAV